MIAKHTFEMNVQFFHHLVQPLNLRKMIHRKECIILFFSLLSFIKNMRYSMNP